jgi:HPt (histidine-containing phosphotransfer) domain-containing protein
MLGALGRLCDAIGSEPARDLVGLFIDDGRVALAAIDGAQRCFDAQGLHGALRDLRGISSMMGAHRLSRLCEMALGTRFAELAPRVAELQQEWSRVEWVLSMWMLSRGPSTPRFQS